MNEYAALEAPRTVDRSTWPVRCVHCGQPVAGLLAHCPQPSCIPRQIADTVRLDRRIEAAEQ